MPSRSAGCACKRASRWALAALVALLEVALVAQAAYVEVKGTHCPGTDNQCSLHGACVMNRQGEHVCNCQWGYTSPDCSRKMCPHGVDPTSLLQEDKKLRLTISPSEGAVITGGSLTVSFHAHEVEFELPLQQVTSDKCAAIFRRFQNLGDLTCTRTSFEGPSTATYELALHSFPVFPIMNNLYQHAGNPLASDFWCNVNNAQVSPASGTVRCVFESLTDLGVKPYAECSNHGDCNPITGLCTCHDGFYGDHCGNNQNDADVLVAPALGPFFKGNALRVSATRELSAEFHLMRADVGGRAVFTMDGRGDTTWHHGSLQLREGDLILGGGALQLQAGASLDMERARARLQDSPLQLQQRSVFPSDGSTSALLLVERLMTASTSPGSSQPDYLRIAKPKGPVLRVSGAGNTVIHDGGLEILKGGLRLERGGIQVLSDGIKVLNGGLSLLNGQTTLTAVNGPVLKLQRDARNGGDDSAAPAEPLLQATSNGSPVFEVHDSGATEIHGGGLHVIAGGVTVASGGQTIASGGLHVASGGVHIASGGLTTRDGFSIEDGGLQVRTEHVNGVALRLGSPNAAFVGALLEFDLSSQPQADTPPFQLLEAVQHGATVFSVDSHGRLETQGDVKTTHGGRVVASGALVSQAQAVFSSVNVAAAETLVIPSSTSYVQVTSDGVARANKAYIDRENAHTGQLLVLQNDDEQPLSGELSVASGAAAIFVFDGGAWRPLTAAAFDTSSLTGVKTFEAANDLNLGEITLSVQSLRVGSQRAGFVAVYGKGGALEQHDSLRFDAASSTLAVEKLELQALRGSVDMRESELRGVDILGGHISHVNMTGIEMVEVQGELFVEDEAFFGASVTVDGQVMGSGAYVDASDARFKRDVVTIANASEVVAQLRGVEYAFTTDEILGRTFPQDGRRELGFLAQEVERVAPQVVTTDGQGFKYIAYARLVPVLVEALKNEQQRVTTGERRLQQLEAETQELRHVLQSQQEMLARLQQRLNVQEPLQTED